jgi:hypothetical protein
MRAEMDQLCKTMINIERNKHIYNTLGKENQPPVSNIPFNCYTHEHVEFNISASIGVLVVYSKLVDNRINATVFINKLMDILKCIPNNESREEVPYTTINYSSSYHTIFKTKPPQSVHGTSSSVHGTSYRKLISEPSEIKKACMSGSRFVWFVVVGNQPTYLSIPELTDSKFLKKSYLMRGTSTIIFDGINLFNIKNRTKQINYPSLRQYTIFNQNKILETTINISQTVGLDYEINSYYPVDGCDIHTKNSAPYSFFEAPLVDYNTINIRRVDQDKKWHIQLCEPFNYDKQEELETNIDETGKPPFPNDICFITHMPIYKHCYILKVGKLVIDSTEHTNTYENITHIMISPCIYISTINHKNELSFSDYFNLLSGYTIIELFISKHPRTEFEAIQKIPSSKISPMKRDILECISVNGVNLNYEKKLTLYTFNIEKKQAYIGLSHFEDCDIIKYTSTNTVLFHYNIC